MQVPEALAAYRTGLECAGPVGAHPRSSQPAFLGPAASCVPDVDHTRNVPRVVQLPL